MEKREKKENKSINLIDLLVLAAILAVVAIAAMNFIRSRAGKQEQQNFQQEVAQRLKETDITFTVKVEDMDREVYQSILKYIEQSKSEKKKGDQMMINGGIIDDAYVTAASATPREELRLVYHETEGGREGSFTLAPETGSRVDVVFTCQGHTDNNITSGLSSQEVRIGRTYVVQTTHFEVRGTVITCDWEKGTYTDGPLSPKETEE